MTGQQSYIPRESLRY